MGLEDKQGVGHSQQVNPSTKVLFPVNTTTLTPRDLVVRALTNSANGAWTMTLAPAAQMVGKFVSIMMISRNSTDDITIQDRAAEGSLASDLTLNLADDKVVLYCDGYTYMKVFSAGSV